MRTTFLICSFVALSGCASSSRVESETTVDAIPAAQLYLGQEPPGTTPEPFAPGIVTTEFWEFGGSFSPDMKEFYLLRMGGDYTEGTLVVFEYAGNEWKESVISPRPGQPFISPDGETMHLGKRYKDNLSAGWSETKSLGEQFEDFRIMRLTASAAGTYYFDEVGNNGDGLIRYSRLVDGVRQDPVVASDEINDGTWLAHPFIAPDESYILWDGRRPDGYGGSDIYISFRQPDGSWSPAVNLGEEINTDAWEASASVTPDGKYLFFNRNIGSDNYENVDILWVDAQIIEDLRPK